jgi:hypothetical protein
MADDKKPKIDLKARLGKSAAAAPTPAPAPVAQVPQISPSGRPMPMPTSVPAPATSQPPEALGSYGAAQGPGGIPIPPAMGSSSSFGGIPVPSGYVAPSPGGGGGFDPSNPLAAAVAPYQGQRQAPAPEPQRIEFDDQSIREANKGGRKQGIIIGTVFAVILGGVGYVAGGASEQSTGRSLAKAGALDLEANATKAQDQLKTLVAKMEAGKKQLISEHKFPEALSRDLGAINVDFDGKQLEGRRFSGFSTDTTRDLVEFITAVQGVNDRKLLIQGLLTKLQKPITEQLAIPEGQIKINYVVAVDKDPAGNVAGFLSHLAEPIAVTGQAVALPTEFTFANPGGSGNTKLPRYANGDIASKPAAIYIVPKTFDTMCPSATGGQIAQLGAQISSFIAELNGEGAADPNAVSDAKAGLIDRAGKLIKELDKVGKPNG